MLEEIDTTAATFLGATLMTVAASRFGIVNLANTQLRRAS
jgi:hypothetical protein